MDSEQNNLVIPEYPDKAKEEGIQGHAIVEFDINSEGTVEHAYVVYSSDMVFDLPAVEAVSQFTFDPRSVPRARPQNQGRSPSGRRGIPEDQRQRSASEDRRPESMHSIKLDPIY